MEDTKQWQDALENKTRPVVIQAGAEWCYPCQVLKPMLIDAVKEHAGAVEYLYIDIDKY
jgi:thioredoxin-like negative regulator of GroEL